MKHLIDVLVGAVSGVLLLVLFHFVGLELEGSQYPIVLGGTIFICAVLNEAGSAIKRKIDAKKSQ